jgi:hypothetical protein
MLKPIKYYKTILNLYNNKTFIIEDKPFTLNDKFINSSNSWSKYLFIYDDPNIKKLRSEILIDDLKNGKYKQSDNVYYNIIKFITNNIYKTDDDTITFLIQNNIKIFTLLLDHRIKNKQSISTFNNDLKMFSRIFKLAYGDDNDIYKKYSKLQTDFNNIVIANETGKNTLNKYEKDKYIDFESILKIRQDLEDIYNKNVKLYGHNDFKTWYSHYKMLILSIYTLTPPLRCDLMNTEILTDLNDIDETIDYVYIPDDDAENSSAQFIFNKKYKGKDPITYNVGYDNDSNERLTKILKESNKYYKRKYLLPTSSNYNVKSTLDNIKNHLKYLIKDHILGVNILRSSYITWRHKNNVNYNKMKDDALKMRNSVNIQLQDYRKINIEQNTDEYEVKIKDSNQQLENKKDYKKQYYIKNIDKIKQYNTDYNDRRNILYILKKYSKDRKQPTKLIMNKYNLYYDNDILKSKNIENCKYYL